MNSVGAYSEMLEEKIEDLENKIINLEQENFELRQKLNTEEECCVMLEKKVKKQAEIIKSLAKALEDNEIDLSYLIFSYLTPDEYVYIREILPYTRSDTDE
jgi:chromosome segregation ATPase